MLGRRRADNTERTAEERAVAAAERARRRGEPPPPMPAAEEPSEPVAEPAPAPGPEPPRPQVEPETSEPEPTAAEPESMEPEPMAVEPMAMEPEPMAWEPEPMAAEPEPEAEPEPIAEEPEPMAAEPESAPMAMEPEPPEPEPMATDAEPEPEPEPDLEFDREPEPEPEPALQGRTAASRTPRPAPPRVPRAPQRRAAPPLANRPPGRRRPLPPAARQASRAGRRVLAGVVLLLLAVVAWLAVRTFQPFHGDPTGLVRVRIPQGADAGQIGDLLAARGIVDSGRFFSINATVTGRRDNLVAGAYTLQRGMRYGTVLDALGKGPKAVKLKTFKVTVPEGLSISELRPRVHDQVGGDYAAAAAAPAALRRARRLGLPRDRKRVEGFLYPATYDLVNGATAGDLVAKQLDAFAGATRKVGYGQARRGRLSRYDVLIIASMVERETRLDRERPLVAAVIYNRLKQGIPLGIDATIRYADGNWSRPLRQSELDRRGPYNTRLRRGLPPTPIGNPGLKSIRAAAHPSDKSYLYYVVKPGTQGHAFSRTEAQFNRDVQRYNAARSDNGGNAP